MTAMVAVVARSAAWAATQQADMYALGVVMCLVVAGPT